MIFCVTGGRYNDIMTEIYVKVEPDSSNFEIDSTGTYPKIHLRSKAQAGRANKELVERLSSIIGKEVRITSGHRSRRKKIAVNDVSRGEVMQKLNSFEQS